jgi:peptide/nickel transport system substrate-binding protein
VADLTKAKRNGGKHPFVSMPTCPPTGHSRRAGREVGAQAEPAGAWRSAAQGHHVPGQARRDGRARAGGRRRGLQLRPPVNKSPKKIATYFDHVDKVEATDKHTVVFTFKNYNAEWDYRFGWGYYSGIMPKEVADAARKDWKNVNGTGPFLLTNYVQGNSLTFTKNPVYWDSETIGGEKLQAALRRHHHLPLHQGRSHPAAALRTGKLDILEAMPLERGDELKKSAPKLQWNKLSATWAAASWRCAWTPSRSTTCACAAR